MSNPHSAFDFGKFIPGFDFLQGLAQGTGAAARPLGKMPEWVAPTISIEEVDKRIAELKAVQFWLEQNMRALAATVQALEVQRMTLATLKGMNVSMAEMAKSFSFPGGATEGAAHNAFADAMSWKTAQPAASAGGYAGWPMSDGPGPAHAPAQAQGAAAFAAAPQPEKASPKANAADSSAAAASAASDTVQEAVQEVAAAQNAAIHQAMNWWGALTQQFQQIASQAMAEPVHQQAMQAAQRASDMAGGMAKTAMDTAKAQAEKMAEATGMKPSTPKAATKETAGAASAAKPTKASAAGKTAGATRAKTAGAAKKAAAPAAKSTAAKKAGGTRRAS